MNKFKKPIKFPLLTELKVPAGRKTLIVSEEDLRTFKGTGGRSFQLWLSSHLEYWWQWEIVEVQGPMLHQGPTKEHPKGRMVSIRSNVKVPMLYVDKYDTKDDVAVKRRQLAARRHSPAVSAVTF